MDPTSRAWKIFLEVYEPLPRQGPGGRAYAERALALCSELPDEPIVADLGCGSGGQTLQLAELTRGKICALDQHAPSVERLAHRIAERGLGDRVQARVGDLANPPLDTASCDLVWSEGALYSVGLEVALAACQRLLRPGGYLAFTEAVWRLDNPPEEVQASFDEDYPTMGRIEDVTAQLERRGLELIDHFTLPDSAWWEDFYTPMEARIAELQKQYQGDAEALSILSQLAREPAMHRQHSKYYAYEFFVARR